MLHLWEQKRRCTLTVGGVYGATEENCFSRQGRTSTGTRLGGTMHSSWSNPGHGTQHLLCFLFVGVRFGLSSGHSPKSQMLNKVGGTHV